MYQTKSDIAKQKPAGRVAESSANIVTRQLTGLREHETKSHVLVELSKATGLTKLQIKFRRKNL